jgi:hypothetical protein
VWPVDGHVVALRPVCKVRLRGDHDPGLPFPVRVPVLTGHGQSAGSGSGILLGVAPGRVGEGGDRRHGGQVGDVLLRSPLRERGAAVEDKARHPDDRHERENEDDEGLAPLAFRFPRWLHPALLPFSSDPNVSQTISRWLTETISNGPNRPSSGVTGL